MLTTRQSITITGRSTINDKEVCGFQATIDSAAPENMNFSSWQVDKALYKANRVECRKDEADFEDYCYTVQEEMAAELAETTEEA